jgi:acetylornithine deacetylase/succinyl-diaminopimelate desuccinylase-like protein
MPGPAATDPGSWQRLLGELATGPRENGTAALHEAAAFLVRAFGELGVEVELVPFEAEPYGLRLAGVIALVGALLYARCLREGQLAAALGTAALVPAVLLAQLDYGVPVFGWIGSERQHHVLAHLPAAAPEQRLVFTAHYDTKTDVLDHVERAPVDLLALAVVPLLFVGVALAFAARRGEGRSAAGVDRAALAGRLARGIAWLAIGYGVLTFAALSAGAFVRQRSPGALDDGASCALLVKLSGALAAAGPLARTEVEVLLLSAEEVGVQGSRLYASERFATPPELPTFVVNLEGVGASDQHAVLGSERFSLRSYPPDPGLVERLAAAHLAELGAPLAVTRFGGATDARSFLAHGVPAVTVITREPGHVFTRNLHSARDDRSRVDEAALERSLAFLLAFARDLDAGPLRP